MRNFFAVLRYRFDNLMSKGLLSLIGLLTLVTAVFVLLMTVLVMLFSSYPVQGESVGEMIWFSLMHALDPGTVVGAEGLAYRAIMLITTFGGLVFLAGLIGIVSGAFDTKVEELRKGRSRVIESDHTLILGWNSRVFSLVKEISLANLSRKKASLPIPVICDLRGGDCPHREPMWSTEVTSADEHVRGGEGREEQKERGERGVRLPARAQVGAGGQGHPITPFALIGLCLPSYSALALSTSPSISGCHIADETRVENRMGGEYDEDDVARRSEIPDLIHGTQYYAKNLLPDVIPLP